MVIEVSYSVSACFSVKTLRTKSASLLGSKVEGTMMYSPGGRRSLVLTSLRLMKVSERAHDEWLKKKFFFRWTFWQPLYYGWYKITDVLKRICLLELNTNTGACAVQPTSSGTCKNEKIKMFTPRGKNLLNSKVVSN